MNIELLEQPEQEFIEFLSAKITEFNWQHWEVSERKPIAVKVTAENQQIIAGASGRTFGDWLLLERLWVDESQRGQHIGSNLLTNIEVAAQQRGCKKVVLDTLNFQAMPFYKKHGYTVEWVQQGYPKTGCKYFMVKTF